MADTEQTHKKQWLAGKAGGISLTPYNPENSAETA